MLGAGRYSAANDGMNRCFVAGVPQQRRRVRKELPKPRDSELVVSPPQPPPMLIAPTGTRSEGPRLRASALPRGALLAQRTPNSATVKKRRRAEARRRSCLKGKTDQKLEVKVRKSWRPSVSYTCGH